MRLSIALPFALALACAGCTTARAAERVAYWQAETARALPTGTARQQAIDFFRAHNLELKCCVSVPPQKPSYFALERDAGRMLWTEYEVAIMVDFSPSEQVERIRVQRWGVGL